MWVVMGSVGHEGFGVHNPHLLWSFPQATRHLPKALSSAGDGSGPWLSSQVQFCSSVQENLPEEKIKSANIEKVE